jgi:hypothetical protein
MQKKVEYFAVRYDHNVMQCQGIQLFGCLYYPGCPYTN